MNAPNTSVRMGNGVGQRVAHRQLSGINGQQQQYQAQSIPQSQASAAAANGGMMRSGVVLAGQHQMPQQSQFGQISGQIHGPITFSAFQGRVNRAQAPGASGQGSQGSGMRPSGMVSRGGNINNGPIQASQGVGIGPSMSSLAGAGAIGGMSGLSGQAIRGEGMMQFDDMGLDEYDVADERQHEIGFDRWEINLDVMSYEDLLRLQERIGYVNKGLNYNRIMAFPRMSKNELQKFLKDLERKKRQEEKAEQKKKQQAQQIDAQNKRALEAQAEQELQPSEHEMLQRNVIEKKNVLRSQRQGTNLQDEQVSKASRLGKSECSNAHSEHQNLEGLVSGKQNGLRQSAAGLLNEQSEASRRQHEVARNERPPRLEQRIPE